MMNRVMRHIEELAGTGPCALLPWWTHTQERVRIWLLGGLEMSLIDLVPIGVDP